MECRKITTQGLWFLLDYYWHTKILKSDILKKIIFY